MRTIAIALTSLVAGCAMSTEGLGRTDARNVYSSAKPAQQVAACVSARLWGVNPAFEEAPGHWIVVRKNGAGVPIVRWDIYDQPGGSRIEFRRSVAPMSGEKKAASCF